VLLGGPGAGPDAAAVHVEGKDTAGTIEFLTTDEGFFDVYEVPMKEGRKFTAADVAFGQTSTQFKATTAILNETAVRALGIGVGGQISWHGVTWDVIGICGDFYYRPYFEAVGPLVLFPAVNELQACVTVRIEPHDVEATMKGIRSVWKSVVPNRPTEFAFLDETRAEAYREQEKLTWFLGLATVLAIGIGVAGLLGLVAVTVEGRKREIAVRKVLGASDAGIAGHLCREFLALIAIASLIACPVAYAGMLYWLQDFAYRISLGPGFFAAGVGVSVAITMLTIGWQVMKAARARAVEALAHQ
jgi:putative ABC transport system permease protein